MKLYEVPNNTRIRVLQPTDPPVCGLEAERGEELKFCHIDGMYSLCYNMNGQVVHLKAWTEVEIVE